MSSQEIIYLNLIRRILETGSKREDRTQVGTLSVFGAFLEFDVSTEFPLLTTKKVFWKGVVEELLFFIRGETDTLQLQQNGVNIWKGNTSREFLDQRGLQDFEVGELGAGYGFQWRNFGGTYIPQKDRKKHVAKDGVDQLQKAIDTIQKDPYSRRIVVSAWNPKAEPQMALQPCHNMFQFYVHEDSHLSIMVNMRSVDVFLGLPFNIASYSLLLYIVAHITGLRPKKVCFSLGDCHLYLNHLEQAKEQLQRECRSLPRLSVVSKKPLELYEFSDFVLEGYDPHPTIKADMAV